ncbi:hypothetical protein QL996_13270 [Planococcus sp. APC 4015]|nr:hypothetical protein [Planococcus sp. APC 4015]
MVFMPKEDGAVAVILTALGSLALGVVCAGATVASWQSADGDFLQWISFGRWIDLPAFATVAFFGALSLAGLLGFAVMVYFGVSGAASDRKRPPKR